VLRAHYTADPERRGPEWKERERRKYTSESAWQAEQEIVFGAGGGERIFADILNRYSDKILIDPETSGFEPSPSWGYFGGFDAGKANPTAALVACIDFDGTIYILREYYQPEMSPKQHTPFLRRLQGFMGNTIYADVNFLRYPCAKQWYIQGHLNAVRGKGHRQLELGARKQ
jgi:hypothetical protein